MEEEKRLFYVATTRAEKSLHLVFPMLSNQKELRSTDAKVDSSRTLTIQVYELLNVHSSLVREEDTTEDGISMGRKILTVVDTVEDLISQLVYSFKAWSKARHANNAQS